MPDESQSIFNGYIGVAVRNLLQGTSGTSSRSASVQSDVASRTYLMVSVFLTNGGYRPSIFPTQHIRGSSAGSKELSNHLWERYNRSLLAADVVTLRTDLTICTERLPVCVFDSWLDCPPSFPWISRELYSITIDHNGNFDSRARIITSYYAIGVPDMAQSSAYLFPFMSAS